MAPVHGLLAAAATLGASSVLTALMSDGSWMVPLLGTVLTIYATGCLLRWLRLPLLVTVAGQVLASGYVVAALHAGATLRWGLLPTDHTLGALGRQVAEAVRLINTYRAPMDHATSVDLLITASMGLTAVLVDAIATQRRHPVAAGVPLVWPLVLCTVARPTTWNPFPFIATALPWVILLGLEGLRRARTWSSVSAEAATPTVDTQDRVGIGRYAHVARLVGAGAVVLAALVPTYAPLGSMDLLHGDGQGPGNASGGPGDGPGAGDGRVRFIDTLDLRRDLGDRSGQPVLRYRTNDAEPPPLKVMATARYEDGQWRPEPVSSAGDTFAAAGPVPPPAGVAAGVPQETYRISVEDNHVQAPFVAAPAYATRLESTTRYRYNASSGHLVVESSPHRYAATYRRPRPLKDPSAAAGADAPGVTPADLAFSGPFEPAVREEARKALGGATTPLDKALAMQTYLRSPARYRYALTLTPSPGAPDPLTAFIRTRQGYCVQFATLMVMMARSEGIPARMAYGFLPGQLEADGSRVVTPADAHAWPELYIGDLGWVRFEATPGVRAEVAPTYSRTARPATPTERPDRRTARPTAPPTTTPTPVSRGARPGAGHSADAVRTLLAVGGVALAALLVGAVPVLTSRHRREQRTSSATRHEDVWTSLLSRLGDLGVTRPAPDTPRRMGAALRHELRLGGAEDAALGRLVDGLEAGRYRPPASVIGVDDATWADHDAVVAHARNNASWVRRARALLWPGDRPPLHRPAGKTISGRAR